MTNPTAATAGQEDHSDPWRFAGEDAGPPQDCGRPDPFHEMPTEVAEQLVEFFANMPDDLADYQLPFDPDAPALDPPGDQDGDR